MKKLLALPVIIFFIQVACAHPGIGIVKDSKGNIYFTDTRQVWKISVDGRQTVAVAHVHTHELYMDTADNLYGEHLWYNGSQQDTWGHYVWCLKNTGEVVKVKEPAEGFLTDYSFVRDVNGNMYWVERFTTSRFKKKTPGGAITTIASGKFRDIRKMYATPGGVVYFIDLHNLYKIDGTGTIILLAQNLTEKAAAGNGPHNDIFGIWTDADQNVYVAVTSDKVVKKVTPASVISIAARSAAPWMPTGGVFDNKGNLWVLECNSDNNQRARKIVNNEEGSAGPSFMRQLLRYGVLPASGIIVLIMVIWVVKRVQGTLKYSRPEVL